MSEAATTNTPATGTPPAAEQQTNTAASTPAAEQRTNQSAENTNLDYDAISQRAYDRAANKFGNEVKKLREENERLKKASMNEAELRQHEADEREKELADRERKLADRENRLFAIKAIKEAGLDDGSGDALAIVDFVMADTEDGITERIKAFNSLVTGIVQKKVDAVFKTNGRTPGVGSDTASNAGGQYESVASRMGKSTAAANQKAQDTRNYYVNGGKK